MKTDLELLAQFHAEGSNEAFGEIVRRHINVVYATARRRLAGDATLADEVTQQVFIALAQQTRRGRAIAHVAAWLHGTTRRAAAHAVRSEHRRRNRESLAHAMQSLESSGPEPAFAPELIDRLLDELPPIDREVVMLRYFEQESFSDIGRSLGLSEDAARMRVARTLERMRDSLARRGITSSVVALGAVLTQEAIAAPAGLAAAVQAAAMVAPISTAMATPFALKWVVGAAALSLVVGLAVFDFRKPHPPVIEHSSSQKPAAARPLPTQVLPVATSLASSVRVPSMAVPPKLPASSPAKPAPARASESNEARLARIKPFLAAGLPITGHVSLQNGNVATDVPVSIVMGQDTRIETGNGGSVTFHPQLADDGTVLYAIEIRSVDPTTGHEIVASTPSIVNFPWANFSIFVGPPDGRDMDAHLVVFDPDPDQFEP